MKAIGKVAMENGGQQSDEDEVKRGRRRLLFMIWKVCQGNFILENDPLPGKS